MQLQGIQIPHQKGLAKLLQLKPSVGMKEGQEGLQPTQFSQCENTLLNPCHAKTRDNQSHAGTVLVLSISTRKPSGSFVLGCSESRPQLFQDAYSGLQLFALPAVCRSAAAQTQHRAHCRTAQGTRWREGSVLFTVQTDIFQILVFLPVPIWKKNILIETRSWFASPFCTFF